MTAIEKIYGANADGGKKLALIDARLLPHAPELAYALTQREDGIGLAVSVSGNDSTERLPDTFACRQDSRLDLAIAATSEREQRRRETDGILF